MRAMRIFVAGCGEQGLIVALYRELMAGKAEVLPHQRMALTALDGVYARPEGGGAGSHVLTTYTSDSGSSDAGWNVAVNVAGVVLDIVLDLLFSSGSGSGLRGGRYW